MEWNRHRQWNRKDEHSKRHRLRGCYKLLLRFKLRQRNRCSQTHKNRCNFSQRSREEGVGGKVSRLRELQTRCWRSRGYALMKQQLEDWAAEKLIQRQTEDGGEGANWANRGRPEQMTAGVAGQQRGLSHGKTQKTRVSTLWSMEAISSYPREMTSQHPTNSSSWLRQWDEENTEDLTQGFFNRMAVAVRS